MQATIDELITSVQEDEDVKVILLHGGRFFSSGNDLSAFSLSKDVNLEAKMEEAY